MLKVQKTLPFLLFPAVTELIEHIHAKSALKIMEKIGETDNKNQHRVSSKYKQKSKLETTKDQSRESLTEPECLWLIFK